MQLVGCASASAATEQNFEHFTFDSGAEGFTAVFADYPNQPDAERFYALQSGWRNVPVDGAGGGLFLSGNNHSDDLFMGYVKKLEGFAPGARYHFDISFHLATDVGAGWFGVGGSPGESVYVKCGLTGTQPQAVEQDSGDYRLNIDKGNQSEGGRDMTAVGDLAGESEEQSGAYAFKTFDLTFDAVANDEGTLYLIIGTDSGFEATSSYYIDDVAVSWLQDDGGPLQRAAAAQMLFDTGAWWGSDLKDAPDFPDVAPGASYAKAVAWAQDQGYLCGYGNGCFGPGDSMTVEQMAAMLYRFFGAPAVDTAPLDAYPDADQIAPWARDAMAYVVEQGFLQPGAELAPQSAATKTLLHEALKQVVVAC